MGREGGVSIDFYALGRAKERNSIDMHVFIDKTIQKEKLLITL